MQHKTGTAAQWTKANPTLAKGEIGVELDTNNLKIGDGVTAWNSLSYLVPTSFNLSAILLAVYPVGSYYWSESDTDPSTLFGGTWTQIKDTFLYASGSKTVGATGGEESHTLSIDEMPSHGHGASADSQGQHTHSLTYTKNDQSAYHGAGSNVGHLGGNGEQWNWSDINTNAAGAHSHNISISSTGGGNAHNNMPPYRVAYCWKRTA